MAIKQTAGRDGLGEFAPKFAQLNDDVLFGEVWSREEKLSLRDRSLVTVTALMAQGLTDSSFQYHHRGYGSVLCHRNVEPVLQCIDVLTG